MSVNAKETDENKIDFELMTSRRPSSASGRRQDTEINDVSQVPARDHSLGDSSNTDDSMIWPLYLTPRFIDHYITGEVIGSGSYAEVRECVDTQTLERYAIKIIDKEYLTKKAPRALANQMQEIRLLRHIQHPNLISMKECLFKEQRIYIILEYCCLNMKELLDDQKDNKFQVGIARRFFYQLCLAVDYLHSNGIVHRDIKPQNMLLTNGGALKLIDFGVSQVLSVYDQRDLCSNYEGSPLFQAPEIVSGQREYRGFKVDIWSCGVTLYLMLYGQYPFMDEALLGLYDKILAQELVVPKDQPPTTLALIDLLMMMLDKDSSRRADIWRVLDHPWIKFVCNLDHSDFFNLALKRHGGKEVYATSQITDVYKSMTVLPYLYQHHVPGLPIKKSVRGTASVERINSLDSTSESNDIEWGTQEQYKLIRVPQVRANRVH